ncbi:hypothetical protein [Halonotius sp. GCM10025705]|uniref:hypothetical protein n=1 Tax=Halonotius sp. GCM10025705 TaxID=3252678 RepID=UPI00361A610D
MSELPDWIEQKVQLNPDHDLQERTVAEVFINEDERPYLTRKQVEARLDGDYSRATVLSRLNGLVSVDVLDVDELENGGIYWIKNDISQWPIPTDVSVEGRPDEMTVSEFFNQRPVSYGQWGVAVILSATLSIWIGGILGTQNVEFAGITGQLVINVSLFAIFIGWGIIGYAVLVSLKDPPEGI